MEIEKYSLASNKMPEIVNVFSDTLGIQRKRKLEFV